MTKYLVLWRLKTEELPDDPDGMEKVMGMLMSNIAKDFEDGTLLDWGLFLDGQYGYGIREMEGSDLQKWLLSVNPLVEVVDIQEVINFDEAQKNIQSVMETMMAMAMQK
jgi:hypothetical protein